MYVCDNALVTDLLNKRGIGAYKGATQLKMIEAPSGFPPTHNIHEFFDHILYMPINDRACFSKYWERVLNEIVAVNKFAESYMEMKNKSPKL